MEVNDSQYLFASCGITWKIENFCFAYPLNEYSILSPEFMLQGLKSVYWRMSLELERKMSPEVTNVEMPPEKTEIEKSPENSLELQSKMPLEETDMEMPPVKTENEKSPENSLELQSKMPPEETAMETAPVKTEVKKSPDNGVVSIYLEMLPSSLTKKNIFVNWEMTLTVGRKVFGPSERKDKFVVHSKHGHIGIATTNEILEHLLSSKDDTINVHFYLIAFYEDKLSIPEEKTSGIFLLYRDLKLFKDMEDNYSDIKLKVKDKYIKAHKIVLRWNKNFETYIEQAEDDVVEIAEFDFKTLDALVNFLYSRDASYCLDDLSISMIRCLKHFNCDALKPYYIPEELSLNSKIQIKKQEHRWAVLDILDKNDFTIRSHPISFLDSSTIWHLTISMRADDRCKFISIFAEITEGERPRYFSLEFALINESQREFFSRRLIRNNESYENLGFDKFVQKKDIGKSFTTDDSVVFLFRIRTSNGIQECSIGCHARQFTLPSKSKPNKQISAKMLDFYTKEIYSNIIVVCKIGYFKANKFILAARSLVFRQKIENNEKSIDIWNVERYLVEIILKYMYTGVLKADAEDMVTLFKISDPGHLNIPSLHEECQQFLYQNSACYNVKKKY